jgi:GNAT superfamily N-acetyltransferase
MIFRKAIKEDVPFIVKMIAEDKLGSLREDYKNPLPEKYFQAFNKINNDPNQELIVVVDDNTEIIGTLQLSFIQYLTYQGGIRAQIEGVRVREDKRGSGIGEKLFNWGITRAKERGAHLIQLTSDKKRPEAIKFYKALGFVDSHEGFKIHFNK